MKRLLSLAVAAVAFTGCLGDETTLNEFCQDRPDVCYGPGKGPYGTTPNGGGIIGGASGGPGINILRAAVGDACEGVQQEGVTTEIRDQCDGQMTCYAHARFLYQGGQDPFPSCSEKLVIKYRCGGSSLEITRETNNPIVNSVWLNC